MKRYYELTKEEKIEALFLLKRSYQAAWVCKGLCVCSRVAYREGSIDVVQYSFISRLLASKFQSQQYSYNERGEIVDSGLWYYWPMGDKEARIAWLDEQILKVKNEK